MAIPSPPLGRAVAWLLVGLLLQVSLGDLWLACTSGPPMETSRAVPSDKEQGVLSDEGPSFVILFAVLAVRQGHVPEDTSFSEPPRSASGVSERDSSFAGTPPTASATAVKPGASQEERYPVAPDFERKALDGTLLRLSSQRGRVVVLNFWATWCAPCRIEIPGFIELQDELGSEGLRFIGVSLDEEGCAVVRPFAEEMGITYPLVIGDEALANEYDGILGLPTTFVLDRQGRIRQRFVGMVSEETLRAVLAELLHEEAPVEGQH